VTAVWALVRAFRMHLILEHRVSISAGATHTPVPACGLCRVSLEHFFTFRIGEYRTVRYFTSEARLQTDSTSSPMLA
jgi:hypothetical protein